MHWSPSTVTNLPNQCHHHGPWTKLLPQLTECDSSSYLKSLESLKIVVILTPTCKTSLQEEGNVYMWRGPHSGRKRHMNMMAPHELPCANTTIVETLKIHNIHVPSLEGNPKRRKKIQRWRISKNPIWIGEIRSRDAMSVNKYHSRRAWTFANNPPH